MLLKQHFDYMKYYRAIEGRFRSPRWRGTNEWDLMETYFDGKYLDISRHGIRLTPTGEGQLDYILPASPIYHHQLVHPAGYPGPPVAIALRMSGYTTSPSPPVTEEVVAKRLAHGVRDWRWRLLRLRPLARQ